MAVECELIFKKQEALEYSNFLRAYEKALASMYRYKIVIDKMNEINSKKPMTEEALINMCGEESVRLELYNAFEALKTAYDVAIRANVQEKVKRQITLKCWVTHFGARPRKAKNR